jgi:hypothetical protein
MVAAATVGAWVELEELEELDELEAVLPAVVALLAFCVAAFIAPLRRNQMYGKTGHHNHAHVEFPECAGHTCPFRVLCDHIPGHAGASTPDLGTTLGARAHTKTS